MNTKLCTCKGLSLCTGNICFWWMEINTIYWFIQGQNKIANNDTLKKCLPFHYSNAWAAPRDTEALSRILVLIICYVSSLDDISILEHDIDLLLLLIMRLCWSEHKTQQNQVCKSFSRKHKSIITFWQY